MQCNAALTMNSDTRGTFKEKLYKKIGLGYLLQRRRYRKLCYFFKKKKKKEKKKKKLKTNLKAISFIEFPNQIVTIVIVKEFRQLKISPYFFKNYFFQ